MSSIQPCGPTAKSIIYQMRHRKKRWAVSVGELIDNSVGNGATVVNVTFKPHYVECLDNGSGCNAEKFAALVSLGMHVEDDLVKNSVSRFGIGAKDAFIWAGGPTRVYSTRRSEARFIEVDWDTFDQLWEYNDIIEGDAAKTLCEEIGLSESGVAVVMPNHTRQMTTQVFADVYKQLAEMFWAAVETGIKIQVEWIPQPRLKKRYGGLLPGKQMPSLIPEYCIDSQLELADGRSIRILGGIITPDVRLSSPGFEYIYGHRVVLTAGGLGAGSLDFERCYFRVFLLGDKESWQVTTNKVGLHDADEAALGQAVYDHCKTILMQSQSEAMSQLADQDLLDEVSELLSEANRKRAKRKPPANHTATKQSTGRGGRHTKAAEVGDELGNCQPNKPVAGQIKIKRAEFEDEKQHLIGQSVVRDRIIRVNVRHPFIKHCLETRDKVGLHVSAMAIWSDAYTKMDENGQLRFTERVDFVEKLSAMLKVTENTQV